MSTNPLRNTARIVQTKSEKGDVKGGVTLFDIDYAIMSYLEDTVLPTLDDNGKALKIPVVYGNSERWNGARRDGIFRDNKGRIQLPLMMIRRTSIAKDESLPTLKNHSSYTTLSKYSKDNRYDRFSLLSNTKPKRELYDISIPQYVEVNYECMGWTTYIEQLNSIIEQLSYSATFWGDKEKFKFRTVVSEYNIVNEVGEGTERVNRVEFNLNVRAYLLPEQVDGQSTTKKSYSMNRVVFSTEVDMTSGTGRLEGLLTTPSPYYDNKDLIDFLSLNNSKVVDGENDSRAIFSGVKLIQAPPQLAGVITSGLTYDGNSYDVKLYVNGVRYYQTTHFTVTSYTNNTLTLTLSPGFPVDSGDEITITGKFIDIVL
jgi:hypothetical protein